MEIRLSEGPRTGAAVPRFLATSIFEGDIDEKVNSLFNDADRGVVHDDFLYSARG